ncbi:LysR family transcriptional regulator [Jatrophihabitans telluris]|uniref:LysR family transcriptional regulator n=1 Tax=Jatrophihabitans telluris TaxID=2038343 RepID=A0ABY4QYC5_9ACTN|nr:LysR family transcriptional regulator [Jatrophihabitans telluris]UQX88623.1 LysR family transcriptional regulator [Jatrophihabitans telluris]
MNNSSVETRRLEYLLELRRLGSMVEVARALGTTTSTVSQQIAALAAEARTPLLEPDGRRVRLTPAGRRLADRAVTILAAVEAARMDLDPDGEPVGVLRVSGFATAIRRSLLPAMVRIARSHPAVQVVVAEHEPYESLALLSSDDIDLALVYDYDLAPVEQDDRFEFRPLWAAAWGLGVPHADAVTGTSLEVFRNFAGREWIGNSRNRADSDVVRLIGSMAGFDPRVTHRADGLELVEELIVAGLGVGLLPMARPVGPGVALIPLAEPAVTLRAYAAVRRGRQQWSPLALLLERLDA